MSKLLLSLALLFTTVTASAQNPQIKTSAGILEGIEVSGMKVFKGIPFAEPPVGELRWKAPQPVKPWTGVRKAHEYGPNPMQQPLFGDMNFGTKAMSEDCLYLNIWTPAKTMDEKLPVLIYFNGGGLIAGSGSEPRYAGMSMGRKGIVSITANYREGIFGFFAHPELSAETKYKGSGNYGFMDQAAAIKWVKENISAFGGDPERITIAGESAGSMSVSALMASPLCKGLFAQAIGSSGSVLRGGRLKTLKEAEQEGQEMAEKLGCKSIKDMRAIPAEELMNRAAVTGLPGYNVDGYFLTEQPEDVYADGKQCKVPLLVGGNNYEMPAAFILQGKAATVENIKNNVKEAFGDETDNILRMYGINTDADVNGDGGIQLASDMFIAFSTWKWGYMHAKTGGCPVYRYIYCHPRPAMRVKGKTAGLAGGVIDKKDDEHEEPLAPGAVHSADIEYAMGTLPTNRVYDWQTEDFIMSDVFSSYYANFIKTGNPNGLGLTEWVPMSADNTTPSLQLDVESKMTDDAKVEQRYELIDELLSK